jgi:hypothetical protein
MKINKPKHNFTMNIPSTVLNRVSRACATPDRVVGIALTALQQGDFVKAVDLFSSQFTYIDHALTLEFTEKERLIEFFTKTRELFPDFVRTDDLIVATGDLVVSQWTLTGTKAESFIGGELHIPFSAQAVSIVQVASYSCSRLMNDKKSFSSSSSKDVWPSRLLPNG